MTNYTPAEMDVLRHSAAQYRGSALPESIDDRLRYCLKKMQVLRNRAGEVAGFGREGFVVTPAGCGLYIWGQEARRQAHINA